MPRGRPTGGTVIIRAAGAYLAELGLGTDVLPRGQTERHKAMLVGEAAPSGPVGGKVWASRAGQFFASAEVQHRHQIRDPDLAEAIAGLIAEEQSHSRWLGDVLRHQSEPVRRTHWVDRVFRIIRRTMGFGLEIAVLVSAEIVAVPYYTAVGRVTKLPSLQPICHRILEDEAFDLQSQAANRSLVVQNGFGLRHGLHRCLRAVICLVVWRQRGPVLSAGGHTGVTFWQECNRLLVDVQERSQRTARSRCASSLAA